MLWVKGPLLEIAKYKYNINMGQCLSYFSTLWTDCETMCTLRVLWHRKSITAPSSVLWGEAIKHFIRKLKSAAVKFFTVGKLSVLQYWLGAYHQLVKSTMAGFTVTSLTSSVTETIWWRRQLGGNNRVIIKAKCFHEEDCLCHLYCWNLSMMLKR